MSVYFIFFELSTLIVKVISISYFIYFIQFNFKTYQICHQTVKPVTLKSNTVILNILQLLILGQTVYIILL